MTAQVNHATAAKTTRADTSTTTTGAGTAYAVFIASNHRGKALDGFVLATCSQDLEACASHIGEPSEGFGNLVRRALNRPVGGKQARQRFAARQASPVVGYPPIEASLRGLDPRLNAVPTPVHAAPHEHISIARDVDATGSNARTVWILLGSTRLPDQSVPTTSCVARSVF
ncbi:MAG: hypothetical protein WBO21_05645, partial [Acidimicrobiia bacterium]